MISLKSPKFQVKLSRKIVSWVTRLWYLFLALPELEMRYKSRVNSFTLVCPPTPKNIPRCLSMFHKISFTRRENRLSRIFHLYKYISRASITYWRHLRGRSVTGWWCTRKGASGCRVFNKTRAYIHEFSIKGSCKLPIQKWENSGKNSTLRSSYSKFANKISNRSSEPFTR